MNKPKFTPGPWHNRRMAVVSDAPIVGGVPGTDDVEHYGGYLIAETVAPENVHLISTAPMMHDLLAALIASDQFGAMLAWSKKYEIDINVNNSVHSAITETLRRINQ